MPVLVARRDHVLVLTIDRQEARNALDRDAATVIGDALEEAEQDAGVRAVVVTGAGDVAFCAGADLRAVAQGDLPMHSARPDWSFGGFVAHPISKPVVAAVNGLALGGGCEIVLASDLAIAATGARLGLPEVKRGLVAGAGGAFRIVAQLPRKVAMQVLLTGEPLDAATALAYGLVNEVVPAGGALDRALEVAGQLAAMSPLAVQGAKRIARAESEAQGWALTDEVTKELMASEDMVEALRAFAEKREPLWTGR